MAMQRRLCTASPSQMAPRSQLRPGLTSAGIPAIMSPTLSSPHTFYKGTDVVIVTSAYIYFSKIQMQIFLLCLRPPSFPSLISDIYKIVTQGTEQLSWKPGGRHTASKYGRKQPKPTDGDGSWRGHGDEQRLQHDRPGQHVSKRNASLYWRQSHESDECHESNESYASDESNELNGSDELHASDESHESHTSDEHGSDEFHALHEPDGPPWYAAAESASTDGSVPWRWTCDWRIWDGNDKPHSGQPRD